MKSEFTANVRVVTSYSDTGERRDEVFILADDPVLNFKFNLEGDHAGALETGYYKLNFAKTEAPVGPAPETTTGPGAPTNLSPGTPTVVSTPVPAPSAPAKK